MTRKRQSQSRNGAVAENRAHRPRVAAPAATPNRLRGSKARPQIVKKTLIRLHHPNYALLTCGFLEAMGVFTNQILNAVARIGA